MKTTLKPISNLSEFASQKELLRLVSLIPGGSYWDSNKLNSILTLPGNNSSILLCNNSDIIGLQISYVRRFLNEQLVNDTHIFLRRLVVSERFHGNGFGKMLMKDFINRSISNFPSVEYVGWQTRINNNKAVSFFRKYGINEGGRIKFNGFEDIIFWDSVKNFKAKVK